MLVEFTWAEIQRGPHPKDQNKQERQERLNVKLSCLSEHVRR